MASRSQSNWQQSGRKDYTEHRRDPSEDKDWKMAGKNRGHRRGRSGNQDRYRPRDFSGSRSRSRSNSGGKGDGGERSLYNYPRNNYSRRQSHSISPPDNGQGSYYRDRKWSPPRNYSHFGKIQSSPKTNLIIEKEMREIYTCISKAKQFKYMYYKIPKLIVNRFYPDLDGDARKKALSYFSDTLSKNIFCLLSNDGTNIFSSKNPNIRQSKLVRQYDLDWFDHYHLGGKERHEIGDFGMHGSIFSDNYGMVAKIVKSVYNGKHIYSDLSSKKESSITLTEKQYQLLRSRYTHKWSLFSCHVYSLVLRYKVIGNQNNHCSLPPNLITKYKLGELFGSPLNTTSEVYYSPFEDIEMYFGSKGNFFTSEIQPGVYLANPPYDVLLVQNVFKTLISHLNKTPGLTFLVNIPIYYDIKVDLLDKHKENIDNVKNHKYYIAENNLSRRKYCHYNYSSDTYIAVCNTKLILLSNLPRDEIKIDLDDFCDEWKKEVLPYIQTEDKEEDKVEDKEVNKTTEIKNTPLS